MVLDSTDRPVRGGQRGRHVFTVRTGVPNTLLWCHTISRRQDECRGPYTVGELFVIDNNEDDDNNGNNVMVRTESHRT